ncbi:MAG: alpha/beta hydrolase [Phenylobacterium sp.]|nr:MAG: alpha/beta hydrolase [Phenylobacterium sp.]
MAWRRVAAELERRGHAAPTPRWPRLSDIVEGFYGALADGVAAELAGEAPALLVAHSGAGALIPALAARLSSPPAGVILVDAILPHPGRSWFDTAPAEMRQRLRAGAQMGELPAWDEWWPPGALERLVPDAAVRSELLAELEPLPQAYFEEPAPEEALTGPVAYLQLSGAYEAEGLVAGRYGWPRVHLPLHHLAMLTHPEAVAAALESLAVQLAEPAHG